MKKYARIFSFIALVLAITFAFSGCGLVNFAATVLGKNNTDSTTGTTSNYLETVPSGDNINYDNLNPTDSAVITPPDSSAPASTAPAGTQAPTSGSANKPVNKPSGSGSTTQNSGTTAPSVDKGDEITEEQIGELTVEGLMDLLFATEDPNVAGKILTTCGFEYDEEQAIFYSQINPWQRMFGFNYIYDMAAPLAGMNYATERIFFEYDNKDWMVQIWKGQYGITAGGEIGLYNKTDKIMQYDCAKDDELIEMSFDFYNNGEYVFSRGPEMHWWLTGFKVFHSGISMSIDLDMTLKFPNIQMANAFETGLKKVVRNSFLDPITYSRTSLTFKIHW